MNEDVFKNYVYSRKKNKEVINLHIETGGVLTVRPHVFQLTSYKRVLTAMKNCERISNSRKAQ